jgi:hypothetical protein
MSFRWNTTAFADAEEADMTHKQQILHKILRLMEALPDDLTYDELIYQISVLRDIEIGLEQADRGEGMEHDEFFDKLLAEYEENKDRLDASSPGGSEGHSGVHRKRVAPNGAGIRKSPKKASRKA